MPFLLDIYIKKEENERFFAYNENFRKKKIVDYKVGSLPVMGPIRSFVHSFRVLKILSKQLNFQN